jgi:hypothetical protein
VAVYGGTFTMKGGIISENSATSAHGGGVSVLNSGKFIMEGGFIERNTARYGGGMSVHNSSFFTKTGGTIYGITKESGEVEDSGKMNTNVQPNPDDPLTYGPAVYLNDNGVKRRGTTAGPTVQLHNPLTGTGDDNWGI